MDDSAPTPEVGPAQPEGLLPPIDEQVEISRSENEAPSQSGVAPSSSGKPNSVLDLAVVLFDRTQMLHDLGSDSRYLLEQAARLHQRAIPHAKKKPFRAALALVRAKSDRPLTEDEANILAAVLAFHQGKLKRKDISKLDLGPVQERQALTIAALLDIAVGLNSCGGETAIERIKFGPEGMWIIVFGPQSDAAAAAAQRRTRLWTQIGYPQVELLESAEAAIRELPLPEETENIGLSADDILSEAGRKTMRFHFARMIAQEAGTRKGEDIEALHRMRVASRRLRAAFDVFAEAFDPGALKIYRNGLRLAGRTLGVVRDLDVFIEKAQNYADSLPDEHCIGLEPVFDIWEAERDAARLKLIEYLDGKEWADFKRKFNIFLNTPGAGARSFPEDQPLPKTARELAPVLVYKRLAATRAYAPYIEHAPVEMLHMLRIEFKKLRYTVEYFEEILDSQAETIILKLKLMQDHLGDLQDAEVASALLRDLGEKLRSSPDTPEETLVELVGYLSFRQAEREQLIATFPQTWRKNFDRPGFRRMLANSIASL